MASRGLELLISTRRRGDAPENASIFLRRGGDAGYIGSRVGPISLIFYDSVVLARFFDLKPTSYGALPFCVLCALAALRESRLPSPASEYMRQDGVVNPVP